MPKTATIITPEGDKTVSSLIDLGCWSTVKTFGQSENCHMQYQYDTSKQSFKILSENRKLTNVNTPLMGKHNAANVAAAVLACQTSGLNLTQIFKSLTKFTNVSRRLKNSQRKKALWEKHQREWKHSDLHYNCSSFCFM